MANTYKRQLKRLAFGIFVITFYQIFSPWKLVIQRRYASETPTSIGTRTDTVLTQQSSSEALNHHGSKDYIERAFGKLEHEFLKSTADEYGPPIRSRDDSIKFMYDAQTPHDWLDLIEGHEKHGLMPLTKRTQRYIYNKQNPADCSGQRFLILNKFSGDDAYGLGAIIQRISDYLSVAIQTNSILLYAMDSSPGEHFIQDIAIGEDQSCGRSFDCIFQPLSSCTISAQNGRDKKVQSLFTNHEDGIDVEAYLAKNGSPIPPIFETALRTMQSDITGEMLKYWWRAQAAAYIMRLNGAATGRLKALRLGKDETCKQHGIQWDVDGQPQEVNLPFPMPEGTTSIHVRHGDKGSEMRLIPFNDYVVQAEKFGAENPLGMWKRAFLSTEDPNVIEQMKTMARILPFSYSSSNSRWTWYWSDIPRLNTGPETQLREFGNRTELTIKWLLQLVMAIECDVFVGTRGSGWNRLIDSLRCIWMSSCKQPFLEVGIENDWAGYGP